MRQAFEIEPTHGIAMASSPLAHVLPQQGAPLLPSDAELPLLAKVRDGG